MTKCPLKTLQKFNKIRGFYMFQHYIAVQLTIQIFILNLKQQYDFMFIIQYFIGYVIVLVVTNMIIFNYHKRYFYVIIHIN